MMGIQKGFKKVMTQSKLSVVRRFVSICDREDRCKLPTSIWRPLTNNYHLQTWKGIRIDKSPFEFALYPTLIYELQPKTIIELGADAGGSAVWLSDHLQLFGIEGTVYSVDIDLSLLDEKAKADSRIHFLQGDSNTIETVLTQELLSTLSHPWLIIEDAHINVVGLMDYFHHNGFQRDDYLIIEDTNKDLWDEWSDWDDKDFLERMGSKLDDMKSWLIAHKSEYLIDTYYQDFYGYNGSKNWNSILKRL